MSDDSEEFANLDKLERDEQLRIMEEWFRERYEDPANRTPYESAEGGYIYIWGGPYNPHEVLDAKFAGLVEDDVIVARSCKSIQMICGNAPRIEPA